jgi:hypothetical protein
MISKLKVLKNLLNEGISSFSEQMMANMLKITRKTKTLIETISRIVDCESKKKCKKLLEKVKTINK